jgi:hypothetical protein
MDPSQTMSMTLADLFLTICANYKISFQSSSRLNCAFRSIWWLSKMQIIVRELL